MNDFCYISTKNNSTWVFAYTIEKKFTDMLRPVILILVFHFLVTVEKSWRRAKEFFSFHKILFILSYTLIVWYDRRKFNRTSHSFPRTLFKKNKYVRQGEHAICRYLLIFCSPIYSETFLKQICSKVDTCLKRTKDFAPKYQLIGQSFINITCLKLTPVLKWTQILVPKVSALDRFHCSYLSKFCLVFGISATPQREKT